MIHDAQAQRGFCVDHIAGIEKLSSFCWANQLRQEAGAAKIREQANFREVLPEHGFFGCDANVRSQRKVHSRARRSTIDRSDYGLRHDSHGNHDFHPSGQKQFEFFGVTARTAFSNLRKVAAGTERAASSREHHNTHGFVFGNAREGATKGHYEFCV